MKNFEEDLQDGIENRKNVTTASVDEKAYRHVFAVLKQEPSYNLSTSFADRTVSMALAHRENTSGREMIWLVVGGLLLLITCIIAFVLSGFKFNFGFLNAVSAYKWLFIYAFVFIFVLQWLDKKLVRNKRAVY